MISVGFSALAAIVISAILWGTATWISKKFNRTEEVEEWIDALGLLLLITSVVVFIMARKELYYLMIGWFQTSP